MNMPCFKSIPQEGEEQQTSYVVLPGDYPIGNGSFLPFMPPFLIPPGHHVPPFPPPSPTSLDDDIFSDDVIHEDESVVEDQPDD